MHETKLLFEHYEWTKQHMIEEGDNLIDLFDEILEMYNYEFMIDTQRCCYDDGSFFLGFHIGNTSFVYRNNIDEYDDFFGCIQKKKL